MKIEDMGELREGNASETIDGCVRLHDKNGFPIMEIYSRVDDCGNFLDDDADLNDLAQDVRQIINFQINERLRI